MFRNMRPSLKTNLIYLKLSHFTKKKPKKTIYLNNIFKK